MANPSTPQAPQKPSAQTPPTSEKVPRKPKTYHLRTQVWAVIRKAGANGKEFIAETRPTLELAEQAGQNEALAKYPFVRATMCEIKEL
jgi:hypothetical protein